MKDGVASSERVFRQTNTHKLADKIPGRRIAAEASGSFFKKRSRKTQVERSPKRRPGMPVPGDKLSASKVLPGRSFKFDVAAER